MLTTTFNPNLPLFFARYGRMSSDKQNPRSPEQQFDTIDLSIKRLGYPWRHVRDYRDDGVSGRRITTRPGLQQMLGDIRAGRIKIDLILVDTFERFGRNDEMDAIRRELLVRHGVLLLTGDSGFADPTSVSGRALSMVESIRATEDGRVKAHNVLRGKRDAVLLGHWPGGPTPFGYKLENVFKEVSGRQELDYCRLVPDPQTSWIVRALYSKAKESMWGATRLARYLTEHLDIPAHLKPFEPTTVRYRLTSEIYVGRLVWGKQSTGIVDDRRVLRRNEEDEWIVVEGFCEPLVSMEDFSIVQALAQRRAAASGRSKVADDGKLIAPLAKGMVLKYPLTGLVRCAACGRAMRPCTSKPYIAASGEPRSYTGYICPGSISGMCLNKTRVPEAWIRQEAIRILLGLLLDGDSPQTTNSPDPSGSKEDTIDDQKRNSKILADLFRLVQHELANSNPPDPSRETALKAERQEIEQAKEGWMRSLARSDLPDAVRRQIEMHFAAAEERIGQIEELLLDLELSQRRSELIVDEVVVQAKLDALQMSLQSENATAMNFQMAQHIDRIECHADGKVVLRISKLGILPNPAALIARLAEEAGPAKRVRGKSKRQPRKRSKLAVNQEGTFLEHCEVLEFALDPYRFAGLPDHLFWMVELEVPVSKCWAETHALEVHQRRLNLGKPKMLTLEALAEIFGKSTPTIRKALQFAKAEIDKMAAA